MPGFDNKDMLLQNIADGLRCDQAPGSMEYRGRYSLGCLEVALFCGDEEVWSGAVSSAIDMIVNELVWDESGDFRDATRAVVRSI